MTALLVSILIGITSNLDNIGIGLSYAMRKSHVPLMYCSMVALTSFLACILGGFTAIRLGHLIPTHLCSLLGSVILVCLGLWTVVQTLVSTAETSTMVKPIGFSEIMFIALAQGLTDLSVGFGAGFARLNVLDIAVSVGVFSFLFFVIPIWFAVRFLPGKFSKGATIFSGLLLIAVGIFV